MAEIHQRCTIIPQGKTAEGNGGGSMYSAVGLAWDCAAVTAGRSPRADGRRIEQWWVVEPASNYHATFAETDVASNRVRCFFFFFGGTKNSSRFR